MEGVIRLGSGFWIIVQHTKNEVFELVIVCRGVTRLSLSRTPWTPDLHSQNIVKGTTTRTTIQLLKRGERRGKETNYSIAL